MVLRAIEERFFWTKEDIARLPVLPLPVEALELMPDQHIEFQPLRFELYQHTIAPRYPMAPPEKPVLVTRVWVKAGYRSPRAPYWDIHQSHLNSIIIPILQKPDITTKWINIIWRGMAPKAYPEVWVEERSIMGYGGSYE